MFLDIDASAQGRALNLILLRILVVESRMPLRYGGGIPMAKQAAEIIPLGLEKVSINAAALACPTLIRVMLEAIGGQSVVVRSTCDVSG